LASITVTPIPTFTSKCIGCGVAGTYHWSQVWNLSIDQHRMRYNA
jgi:hypothetical protein